MGASDRGEVLGWDFSEHSVRTWLSAAAFTLDSQGRSFVCFPSVGAVTSSPWYSEMMPNGPVFFPSDFIEEVCHFFHGWWYDVCSTCLLWFNFFLMNSYIFSFVITLSLYLQVLLKLFWIWGEVWYVEDLFWNAYLPVFYLKTIAVIK